MTRASSSADRRDRILDAALQCFLESGIPSTTVEDIRARSGSSVGSIYHHFGSKEELAAALYLGLLRKYQQGSLSVLRGSRGAEETIKALVRYHLRWVEKHTDWSRYLFEMRTAEAVRSAEKEIGMLNRDFAVALKAWAQQYIDDGKIRSAPVDVIVALVFGPAQSFARFWLAGATGTSIQRAAQMIGQSAWDGLRAR